VNHKERVAAAIAHREADRIPKGEVDIEPEFARALVGADLPPFELKLHVLQALNMDLWVVGDWPRPQVGTTAQGYAILRDVWGRVMVDNGVTTDTIEFPIPDLDRAASYRYPTPDSIPGDELRWAVHATDYFTVGLINSVFEDVYNLIGFDKYMLRLASDPGALRPLAQRCAEFEVAKAAKFLDIGADAIFVVEDIAHNTGTFISPQALRSEIFSWMSWQVAEIKRHRQVPVFLHSDGNLNAVLDDIVACGFDGLHSLQPSANMDIGRIKARYGDRLCLMGNIDLNYVLSFGTPTEVEEAVKQTIAVAAPGGGYILSTCNTLIRAIPPVNALTMYHAGDSWGRYPIGGS
jgi:uroporphyrinogen decarboxylase